MITLLYLYFNFKKLKFMDENIWKQNKVVFQQQTGLSVEGNESTYISWLNTIFTIENNKLLKSINGMVLQIRDFRR